MEFTRRRLAEAIGMAAFLPQGSQDAIPASSLRERPDTPKLCLPGGQDEAALAASAVLHRFVPIGGGLVERHGGRSPLHGDRCSPRAG